MNGASFGLSGGDAGVWSPGRGIVVVRFSGFGHAAFAAPVIERIDFALKGGNTLALFFDAGALERYDSELRTRLTNHLRVHREGIAKLEVLVRSRIVAMGVSVAGLALGGIIKSHAESKTFRPAVEAELRERRVIGFSVDALDARAPSEAAR
jgi:hypothetical protein